MRIIFGVLAAALSVYSVLIFIRIIFSWFGNFVSGWPVQIIKRVTDPYLNWWRNNLRLQVGFLDFSAIAGIVFLSLLQNIFYVISLTENITIWFILANILMAVWRIISVILGFFIVIIILRGFAYMTNRNIYNPFWNIIDSISRPVLYRMNRLIYGKKIGGFLKGIVISLIIFIGIMIGGWFLVNYLTGLLIGMQVNVSS